MERERSDETDRTAVLLIVEPADAPLSHDELPTHPALRPRVIRADDLSPSHLGHEVAAVLVVAGARLDAAWNTLAVVRRITAAGAGFTPLALATHSTVDATLQLRAAESGAADCLQRPLAGPVAGAKLGAYAELWRQRIAAEQRSAAASRESEDRFRVMADHAPVLLWMAASDARCVYFNKPWLAFTGRTLDQEVDFGWAEGVHPEDFQHCVDTYMRAFSTRQPFEMDYRLRRHDGVYRWIYDRAAPRWDELGHFAGFVGSCIDITDRIDAERARDELLAREQAARTEAERLSRLKDEFLATVSHELRTPMNAITGWTDMLAEGGLEAAEVVAAYEAIRRNARIQNHLISDILDVSHIIRGNFKIQARSVEAASFITGAVESIRLSAEARRIDLTVSIEPAIGLVTGDPVRLQQVVWNLLSNAVKFTPSGGTVTVDARRSGSQLEVVVADSGEGIDPAFLPHVFERFRQGYGGIDRRHGGLGLGLSIAKHLADLHGGTIEAHSDGLGHGASFTLCLPLAAVRLRNAAGAEASAEAIESAREKTLLGLVVLIVDDQEDAQQLLRFMLSRHGAEVATAGSAAEAMHIWSSRRFDVLLSDIGMPDETGLELIRKVRASADAERNAIPAVALTAHARAEDRQAALLAGFQEHLPKPVDIERLVAAVARLAGRAYEPQVLS